MSNLSVSAILLDNLKESLIYNIGQNVDPVPGLLDDLHELRLFIREVSGQQRENQFAKQLENDIRNLVFELEDTIETYIVLASTQKHKGLIARTAGATNYLSKLHSLRNLMSNSREKLKDITRSANLQRIASVAFEVDEISNMKTVKQIPPADYVVGLQDSADSVIELLTGESQGQSEQLEVISIIGMPGLGKTTLARRVFADPRIEYEFFIRVFVYVSQEYDRKEVFSRILASVTHIDEETRERTDTELAQLVVQHLKRKKYLIVMDDVWTADAWENLSSAFPNDNNGSRVLITSRNADVAHHAKSKIQPYRLRFLLQEEAEELLRRKVFGENKCPEELWSYESKILAKCDGLPLAIVVVAGILRTYGSSTSRWRMVSDNMNDYIAKDEKLSNDVIRRSYDHLPNDLKPCFLYLGVFPEGFEIPVWKLLRLWIAEGFIQQQHQSFQTIEDIAEEYLAELVSRNLVMMGQKRSNGQIKTCRLNDMLRNFCKAEATKEYLFHEIRWQDEGNSSRRSSSHNERRLCVNSHVEEFTKAKPPVEHVRSFLSFPKVETVLSQEHISSVLKDFKLLRVLDVSSINFSRFPLELFYLVLLRFIAISSSFKVLPEKMSNLENLQTIIIETSSRTLEIKADIWKMAQLRHLHTNCSTTIPKGKDESLINANLQTLSTISPESCRRELFDKTPKLKKLGIRGRLGSGIEEIFDSLVKLNFLENLKLLNDSTTSKLPSLPPHYTFPRNLSRLTLLNTLLDWSYMSILGRLENLEVLKLKDNAFQGEFWETEEGGYCRLRVLHIGGTDLVRWKARASSLPTLESLIIRDCKRLGAIPSDLGDISSLRLISLHNTNVSAVSSARKIQVLKLRVQAQQAGPKGSVLKLHVYPPE